MYVVSLYLYCPASSNYYTFKLVKIFHIVTFFVIERIRVIFYRMMPLSEYPMKLNCRHLMSKWDGFGNIGTYIRHDKRQLLHKITVIFLYPANNHCLWIGTYFLNKSILGAPWQNNLLDMNQVDKVRILHQNRR